MNKNKEKLLAKRYSSEKRFQFLGKSAIFMALLFLAIFIFKIFSTGYTAFQKTWLIVPVNFDAETMYLDANPSKEDLEDADYFEISLQSMFNLDKNANEKQQNELKKMVSYFFEREIKQELINDPSLLGKTKDVYITASDDLDQVFKGNYPRDLPENQRRVTDYQLKIFDQLVEQGKVESKFNLSFFTYPDSREAELAGIASSFMGSIFSILVCLAIAFPVAVLAAIYLEEFAPKNRFTDFIEVNINNLAAVPSIVFGLLGLGILLAVFQLPRSTPLVGGITLSLMTLPTIIIACRASLKAVPPSIREAALAMGASRMQTTMHHTVPLSMPGTLSGTIIGLAQALGETAPLILIGMVAFVNTIPGSPMDPAASLPVQIYIWAESAERGFVEKVSACIMVLLGFLIVMNLFAQIIRHKFEKNGVNMIKISAKNVDVFYGKKQALFNINLDIEENQVTALIGPSGCGKSTFLRCLNRMNDVIDICKVQGEIVINDFNINDKGCDVVRLREKIGMVFQKPNPFPKTLYENISYGPTIHGMAQSKQEMDEIVETSLKKAALWEEVKDRLHEPGTGLSGGQQQRLCIARAISVQPEVILMDEPCSALDPIATAQIEELIDELKKEHTIIIVTHSMAQAARVSQNTGFFHLGELIEHGSTDKIFKNPENNKTQDYITGRFG